MKRKHALIALLFVFFTLILFLGGFVCFAFLGEGGTEVEVVVRKGEAATQVVQMLADSGVVSDPDALEFVLKLTKIDRRIKSGVYRFRKNSPVLKVAWRLYKGPNVKGVLVTIPEGKRLQAIAGIIARRLGNDSLRFMELAEDSVFIKRLAEKYGFPPPKSLEGYLFPDSYKFSYFEDEAIIIDRMVGRLMEVLRQNGLLVEMKRKKMSLHELLTLASIVECEAAVDSERPVIAAVFLNRLKHGMPLESCATVEYALPRHKKKLTYRDLQIDSPYNTYIHIGLPPGPICSPGLNSIKAVLKPTKVPYLYFVSKGDGTHLFAQTYRQHLANKRKANLLQKRRR